MGEFDVVVVVAGPAGSVAAYALARRGKRVALLDRARFPRPKLCGGLLTWKSMRLLGAVLGLDAPFLLESGVINYASDRYSIFGPRQLLAAGQLSFPFHFTDRNRFDALLLECAARAGAQVFEETQVASCVPHKGVVTTTAGREIRAHYLIGADGVNSVVRSCFPHDRVDRDRWKWNLAPAIEISLPPDRFPRPVDHPELHIGMLDAGYGWVFPNRDRVVLGICGLRRNISNYSNKFREYLEYLDISDPSGISLKGHPLPYGNYLEKPWCGRTLLAGDAAGLVEPLFGEGIFFAMASGLYAGKSVAKALEHGGNSARFYEQRLHGQLLPELKASDRLRWLLFRGVNLLGDRALGLFVRAASRRLGDMVHGKRSYHWTRKKNWDFLKGCQ
ncbi:NAD(P)/FAD-dependent oxidoreductase [Salidesulfovibrio onnuriiensis]|uniref:NAD(P)/FAD-dependent oxidoreductase n=1 Tax=Salidesulfovibrio onnuriiensis TaxID=2583823 RepID=UPI0011CB5F67|nr:NAD(P)/FAD-dependent oxidoreductase [Salidesulfovibrio onnuriiensis]